MKTTIVQRAQQFANPLTGEVIDLDAPDVDLAKHLEALREYKSVLDEHRRIINQELIRRLDTAASWTRHLDGGLKISAPSPAPEEAWDGAELREALLAHVDSGELSIEAVDAAVEIEVTYKVKKAGVQRLRKLGGEIAALVEFLCKEKPRDYRNVRVERPLP